MRPGRRILIQREEYRREVHKHIQKEKAGEHQEQDEDKILPKPTSPLPSRSVGNIEGILLGAAVDVSDVEALLGDDGFPEAEAATSGDVALAARVAAPVDEGGGEDGEAGRLGGPPAVPGRDGAAVAEPGRGALRHVGPVGDGEAVVDEPEHRDRELDSELGRGLEDVLDGEAQVAGGPGAAAVEGVGNSDLGVAHVREDGVLQLVAAALESAL